MVDEAAMKPPVASLERMNEDEAEGGGGSLENGVDAGPHAIVGGDDARH